NGSVVARNLLAPLMRLLGFHGHGGDGPRDQAVDADRIAGNLAPAIFALVDTAQRRLDLGNELALPVAGSKLDSPVGFAGGAVVEIGLADRPILQALQRSDRRFEDRFLPFEQQYAKIIELRLAHIFL